MTMASADQPQFHFRDIAAQGFPRMWRHAAALIIVALAIGWLPNFAIANAHLPVLDVRHWNVRAWGFQLARNIITALLYGALMFVAARIAVADRKGVAAALADAAVATLKVSPRLIPILLLLQSPALAVTLALPWFLRGGRARDRFAAQPLLASLAWARLWSALPRS